MKQSTINKYLKIIEESKEIGLREYCKQNGLDYKNVNSKINKLKKEDKQLIDNDEKSEIAYIRDDSGKIQYYEYKIYKKNKAPLCGRFTREEMDTIYRLYSYYGTSLTQRSVARHFVDISLVDFKRILRAFNITKASACFAPHKFEEESEETLHEIQLREKENNFLRKLEENRIKNNEILLQKYAQENIELKEKLNDWANVTITLPDIKPLELKTEVTNDKSINIYLADFHIGARVVSGSLYNHNINYGKDEIIRRLTCVLNSISKLGPFNTINIVLLGDNIDCCGVSGRTARLDHELPENMDPREQINAYIDIMLWVVQSISNIACKINIYSVPGGNHSGNFEYITTKALFAMIEKMYPTIKTYLFEKFFGVFEENNEVFLITHGKDPQFMKKNMPLYLNDRTKVMLYEWLDTNGIRGNNIHIIKADLHSNNLDSCKKLDYRNVLSLFCDSDYSAYNFSANSYGVSYDLFDRGLLLRGTIENM